jgi:hypothetical protein
VLAPLTYSTHVGRPTPEAPSGCIARPCRSPSAYTAGCGGGGYGAPGRSREAVREVARAVVGQNAADVHAAATEPAQGMAEGTSRRWWRGRPPAARHRRRVNDRPPPRAGSPNRYLCAGSRSRSGRNPMPEAADPAELLGVQQIPGASVLIAVGEAARRPRRERPARCTMRDAVAALTPTAAAIWAHVHRDRRRTLMLSAIAAAVSRGLVCGRLDRSSRPAWPSVRYRAHHFCTVRSETA